MVIGSDEIPMRLIIKELQINHSIFFEGLKGGGTGMIASSSTFRTHPGRVIRDLFRLLNTVYGIVRKH